MPPQEGAGLRDLALTQILFIIGLSGSARPESWDRRMFVFWCSRSRFLSPLGCRRYLSQPADAAGGRTLQWAKLGFSEAAGFHGAWNLWLYVITNTSEIGLQLTTNLAYAIGPRVRGFHRTSG
jgi:hypothetical protein